jgi:hypothetical protein
MVKAQRELRQAFRYVVFSLNEDSLDSKFTE